MVGTQYSPGGRFIEYVEGSPADIISRGTKIEDLGEKMEESANVLEDIKTRASDQQGKAIEKLRETIGDSYETLHKAAALYTPVGPVIRTYGEELEKVQPRIKTRVDNCRELASEFWAQEGNLEPYPGSEDDEEQQELDQAKKAAYEAWETEAKLFDDDYDTWEEAFDTAVSGITKEMSGKIEDGGWRSFLDGLSKVLGWAGLIVGVAALIIGGPILGAIAAAIAVLTLVVTILQVFEGDANGWDVAIAAVGVIPVGKLGKLAQGRYAEFADDAFKNFKPSTYTAAFKNPKETSTLYSAFKTGGARNGLAKMLTGRNRDDLVGDALGYTVGGPIGPFSPSSVFYYDVGHSVVSNVLKYEGWASKAIPGYDGLSGIPGYSTGKTILG